MQIFSSEILKEEIDFKTYKDFVKMYLVCHENNCPPFILDVYLWNITESSFCYCYYWGIVQWKYHEPISKQIDLFPNKELAEERIKILKTQYKNNSISVFSNK